MLSIVVTVYNEAKHVRDLLDSLVVQEGDPEIVIVDAKSEDGTQGIVESYADDHDGVRLIVEAGTRGHGRNVGVEAAEGDHVAFTDGDCIANPFWTRHLEKQLQETEIAAGRTIELGYWAFVNLHRVELEHRGTDITYPSCNLAYPRELFLDIGGFDTRLITAEDIDLNRRAIEAGADIGVAEEAIIYHRVRDSFTGFLEQAFWNGYGRKQLTLKHGRLWSDYSFTEMLRTQWHTWGIVRLWAATAGYLAAYVREEPPDYE